MGKMKAHKTRVPEIPRGFKRIGDNEDETNILRFVISQDITPDTLVLLCDDHSSTEDSPLYQVGYIRPNPEDDSTYFFRRVRNPANQEERRHYNDLIDLLAEVD